MLNHSGAALPAADATEIVSSRRFDAERARVYGAFADPEQLARWWGPRGFRNTIHEFDLRSGGRWRFTMHGPDGKNYDNGKDFIEVVAPERIVFQHLGPMHRFVMTMTFVEIGARTELTWRMRFESEREAEPVRKFIEGANEENFDRLAAHLAGTLGE